MCAEHCPHPEAAGRIDIIMKKGMTLGHAWKRFYTQSIITAPLWRTSATASWTVGKTVPDRRRHRHGYPAWRLGVRPLQFFDPAG